MSEIWKNNLIRDRMCYYRFKNKTWLDKEYVIKDFNLNLIQEGICYHRCFKIKLDKRKNMLLEKTIKNLTRQRICCYTF